MHTRDMTLKMDGSGALSRVVARVQLTHVATEPTGAGAATGRKVHVQQRFSAKVLTL